jgi:hypothetical protein
MVLVASWRSDGIPWGVGQRESAIGGSVMEVKSGVSDGVVRLDDPAGGTRELAPMPSAHVINLLGSGEWALLVEALAMDHTQATRTRRRAGRSRPAKPAT